jgi:hypothetical protein
MWVVFQLKEKLSENGKYHQKNGIIRAYSKRVFAWLEYMKYLKEDYPYLFPFLSEQTRLTWVQARRLSKAEAKDSCCQPH